MGRSKIKEKKRDFAGHHPLVKPGQVVHGIQLLFFKSSQRHIQIDFLLKLLSLLCTKVA